MVLSRSAVGDRTWLPHDENYEMENLGNSRVGDTSLHISEHISSRTGRYTLHTPCVPR